MTGDARTEKLMRAESTVRLLPVPPHSVEAEQALIGSLLIDAAAWSAVASVIRSGDLYRPDHQAIFEAVATLAARGEKHDVVTVAGRLERTTKLEAVGGVAYLSSLARETPTAANVLAYAKVVRDRSTLRSLASFANDLERLVADARGRSADELIGDATRRLLELQTSARVGKGLIPSEDLVRELIDDLDRRRDHEMGLAIGLEDFDRLTGGLEPGDLVVIAARPGMGKTSLLVTVAAEVAKASPAAVFSAEMPAQQLMRRCVALLGRVSQTRLRRARELTDADWAAICPAATAVGQLKLWIDDTPLPPLTHIRAEAFALKARAGLGVILVDYVQLVAGAGANRYEQLRDVAYGLKALAKELAVPIIVLAQLNRAVEARDRNKRPHLSDLRDSGAIEEAADIVGLLYAEGYYHRDFDMPDVLECQVAKNRNGERGECLWSFCGDYSRVTVLEEGSRAQYRRLQAQANSQRRRGASNDL
jgi:replicative DNA helicase